MNLINIKMDFAFFLSVALATVAGLAQGSVKAAVVGPPAGSGAVDGVAPATVFELGTGGIGHINLVPYYTVLGGFDTYLNVINTDTRNGKVVKVRFRTGANADTVFDFTLLLAPGDMWAAAVTRDAASGRPRLASGDPSCTLPADVRQTFGTAQLADWPQSTAAAQAGEGQVEIITMADIPPASTVLIAALRPAAGGTPCAAEVLAPLATDPASYAQARSLGLEVPTTGLLTDWTLINVPRASSFTGIATAIEARAGAGGAAGYGNIVFSPQTGVAVPSLEQIRQQTADPLLRGAVADNAAAAGQGLAGVAPGLAARQSDLPDLSTPYLPAGLNTLAGGVATRVQAHALSKTLAVAAITNQYVLDPALDARTAWVLSLPTRRLNVAAHPQSGGFRYTNWTVDDAGNPLGLGTSNYFDPGFVNPLSSQPVCFLALRHLNADAATAAGRRTATVYADRDGGLAGNFDQSPSVPGPSHQLLCGSTSAIWFIPGAMGSLATGSVLGPTATPLILPLLPKSGWTRFETRGVGRQGLPMIGFAAIELFNAAAAPGVAGTYGVTFPHAMTSVP